MNKEPDILTQVLTAANIADARAKIGRLEREGYIKENIFVLTHDKKRTEEITEQTDAHQIGITEEGIITAVANLFRSTGDELRAKLRAMGVQAKHAEQLEIEMDRGKIVILGWNGLTYADNAYNDNISYYPSDTFVPMT